MIFLISQILPVVSVVCAAFLAYNGVEGWGWFAFIAIMFGGVDVVQKHVSAKEKTPDQEKSA